MVEGGFPREVILEQALEEQAGQAEEGRLGREGGSEGSVS